ncbi:hypothetical protein FHG87_004884 [Trinorchestia longiramus]|nr:hypothetical protein FHG87_004884 [Trinorchestia longiramus]
MKLLLLLSLLAVAFRSALSDKLPGQSRHLGGYLQPQNLAAAKRCIGRIETTSMIQSVVIYQPITKIITVSETKPVVHQAVQTITKVENDVSEVEVQSFSTIRQTSLVTDIRTLIDAVPLPPITSTVFDSYTSISTRVHVRRVPVTTTSIEREEKTRTVFVTELSTKSVLVPQTTTVSLRQRPIFEPSLTTTVLTIEVEKTPLPDTSTFYFTETRLATSTHYVTPTSVVQDRRVESTEPRIMSSEIISYTTKTDYIPIYSTGFVAVTTTIFNTEVAFSTTKAFGEKTHTIRKVIPSTIVIPVEETVTATIEHHITQEHLETFSVIGTGVNTVRSPDRTVPVILTDIVTEYFTRTSEYQPPTMTKPATVQIKCGETRTVSQQGYYYG